MDKVIGGTPISGPPLCMTCQHGIAVRGYNLKEGVHCGYMGRIIHFPVRECSKYTNAATPDLLEMKKIAWVIESRNRGTWGFSGEKQLEIVVRPPSTEPEMPTQGPI